MYQKNIFKIATLLILLILFYSYITHRDILENTEKDNEECITKIENYTVNGVSLEPIIYDNQSVKILEMYYLCNSVKREDIVLYNYFGNKNPLIKIIKGIPDDTFHLQKTGNGWNILLNGDLLVNSKNEVYVLDKTAHNILSLYEKDYNGLIPENTYLIMGNLATGSLDSTHFGLVDKGDILGKVVC